MSKFWAKLFVVFVFLGAMWLIDKRFSDLQNEYKNKLISVDKENFDYMVNTGFGTFIIRASGENSEAAEKDLKDRVERAKTNKWTIIGSKKAILYNNKVWLYQTIYRLPD